MTSYTNCCVIGCGNSYANTQGKNISFHGFPNKPYEVERRKKWIAAMKRENFDGSSWEPTKNTKVCSVHFVGGKPSNVMFHPGYIPTIFPALNSKNFSVKSLLRYERAYDKWKKKTEETKAKEGENFRTDNIKEEKFLTVDIKEEKVSIEYHEGPLCNSACTQCSFDYDKSFFSFSCEKYGSDRQTQCNINNSLEFYFNRCKNM